MTSLDVPRPTGRGYRQPRCPGCGATHLHCFCGDLPWLDVSTPVTALIHAGEARRPTNTGRLVPRLLPRGRALLRGHRDQRLEPDRLPLAGHPSWLLFPTPAAVPLEEALARTTEPIHLIVPDGTWTQTRRMVRREAVLHGALAVKLTDVPPTRYTLRRGPRLDTVCTLEAVAHALGAIESLAVRDRMLAVVDLLVERGEAIRRGD